MCIFCKHFYFSPGCDGYSEMTPGYPMTIACLKDHWEVDELEDTMRTFRTKMSTAKKCKDYEYIPIEQI